MFAALSHSLQLGGLDHDHKCGDRGFENAYLDCMARSAYSRPRSWNFMIRNDQLRFLSNFLLQDESKSLSSRKTIEM